MRSRAWPVDADNKGLRAILVTTSNLGSHIATVIEIQLSVALWDHSIAIDFINIGNGYHMTCVAGVLETLQW